MQNEYVNGRVRVYQTVNEALAVIKQQEGCGSIRYVVVTTNDELVYLRNRRQARESFELLAERYGRKCLGCSSDRRLLVDHIVPLKRGGDSYIENLQLLCRQCNFTKGLRIIDYRPSPFVDGGVTCDQCLAYRTDTERLIGLENEEYDICKDCWPRVLQWHPALVEINSREILFPAVA